MNAEVMTNVQRVKRALQNMPSFFSLDDLMNHPAIHGILNKSQVQRALRSIPYVKNGRVRGRRTPMFQR